MAHARSFRLHLQQTPSPLAQDPSADPAMLAQSLTL